MFEKYTSTKFCCHHQYQVNRQYTFLFRLHTDYDKNILLKQII